MRIILINIIVILVVSLSGCASHKSVTSEVSSDSSHDAYKTHIDSSLRHDSIFLHDSVYLKDSVFVAVHGDTITTERWHTAYRDKILYKDKIVYKNLVDTVLVHDTLRQDSVRTEISQQKVSAWQGFCKGFNYTLTSWIMIIILILYINHKLNK